MQPLDTNSEIKSTMAAAPATRPNPFDAFRRNNELKQREKALAHTSAQTKADFMSDAPSPRKISKSITSVQRESNDMFAEEGTPLYSEKSEIPNQTEASLKIEAAADRMHGGKLKDIKLVSGYEALALAHRRFGQAPEKTSEPMFPASGSRPGKPALTPIKIVLTRDMVFSEINREAGVMRAMVSINAMTGYYEVSDAERMGVRDRLMAMEPAKLSGLIRAYEFAANHVSMMCDDKLPRRAALDSNPQLKVFFEKNGTYDDVSDHSNAVQWEAEAALVDTRDTGKIRKPKR
jgi:hypothetical protein